MQTSRFDSIFKGGILLILIAFLFLFFRYSEQVDNNRFQFSYNAERSSIFVGDGKTGELYIGTSFIDGHLNWLKVNPLTGAQEIVKAPPR